MLDKIPVAIVLIAGFIWIRLKSRHVGEGHSHKALGIGVYGVLPGLLVIEKVYLFDRWRWDRSLLLWTECAALGLTFLFVGYCFCTRWEEGLGRLPGLRTLGRGAAGPAEPGDPEP